MRGFCCSVIMNSFFDISGLSTLLIMKNILSRQTRGKALIYSEKYQSDSSLLWNDLLREMVKTRKAEWSIVPDSYIMYPVTYKEQDRLLECACYDNQEIGNYMHYMDIRRNVKQEFLLEKMELI